MRIELYRAIEGDAPVVSDFIDAHLRDDVIIPESRIREMIVQPNRRFLLILVDQKFAGVCFLCGDGEVRLLILATWARGPGVGREVIRRLQPKSLRVNTPASTGDPSGFVTNGYRPKAGDRPTPNANFYERINP